MFNFCVGFPHKIPVYVGASRGLVVKYKQTGRPAHGEDGFGKTKFSHNPDLTNIQTAEPACLAILRFVKSMPGERKNNNVRW